MATKKIQILDSMIKQAENANTLGGRSASYFAVASEVNELQQLVGDTSVSNQISIAVESITADDLGVYVQDTEPTEAVEGDIWIDSSTDSEDYVPINHVHNDATASTSGFMSAADKAKLDSITFDGNANNENDGFSPVATVTQTESGAVISITDKDGTTTATITNGKDGKDGADGKPGKDGEDGKDGEPGKSAYECAKEAGFVGTEAEFAELLMSNSIKQYGAVGDGVADDTAAFQNALANERVVTVPGGTYKLSGELKIGNQCMLELSQDTVLNFTQTSGNCISLGMYSTLTGNHAVVQVPYSFNGNVVNADSADTTLDEIYTLHPWIKWDPQWKYGRFLTDLSITKPDSRGFHYSVNGDTCGTAVSVLADSNDAVNHMWGLHFSGLRIAGAFTYGIHGVCKNEAWLHEMRIDAFIDACETGVCLENCNNTYVSAVVQPRTALSSDGKNIVYAKNGFKLINSKNADLSGSRVWDWNDDKTLSGVSSEYKMVALVGNCRGLILNAFQYYETSTDIREQIYTDTPSNLEQMVILQEPFTRWFKPKENEPYFFNGNTDKRLALKEEIDEYFQTDRIPLFTDVMSTSKDKNGDIYNGTGTAPGYYDSKFTTLTDGSAGAYYIHTGFIPCKKGDSFYTDGIKLREDGVVRVAFFDADYNYVAHVNGGNMISGNYYVSTVTGENGFKLTIANLNDANLNKIAYARFNFNLLDLGENPVMSVNGEIKFTQAGFLSDDIKVKAENVVGNGSGGSAPADWNAKDGEPGHVLNRPFYESPETVFPETTLVADEDGVMSAEAEVSIQVGDTCTVYWNGNPYVCKVGEMDDGSGMMSPVLGNYAAISGLGNTGEPFFVACAPGMIVSMDLTGVTECTLKIDKLNIVKLPFRYYEPVFYVDAYVSEADDGSYVCTTKVTPNMLKKALDNGQTVIARMHRYYSGMLQYIYLPLTSLFPDSMSLVYFVGFWSITQRGSLALGFDTSGGESVYDAPFECTLALANK